MALLLLLNDKCKLESLQRDGRPGWRFPQTAGCKARSCFVDRNNCQRIYLADNFYLIKSQEKVSVVFFILIFYNKFNKFQLGPFRATLEY